MELIQTDEQRYRERVTKLLDQYNKTQTPELAEKLDQAYSEWLDSYFAEQED